MTSTRCLRCRSRVPAAASGTSIPSTSSTAAPSPSPTTASAAPPGRAAAAAVPWTETHLRHPRSARDQVNCALSLQPRKVAAKQGGLTQTGAGNRDPAWCVRAIPGIRPLHPFFDVASFGRTHSVRLALSLGEPWTSAPPQECPGPRSVPGFQVRRLSSAFPNRQGQGRGDFGRRETAAVVAGLVLQQQPQLSCRPRSGAGLDRPRKRGSAVVH